MSRCHPFIFGLMLSTVLMSLTAQAQKKLPQLNPDQLDKSIRSLMDSASIPGLSIAIIRNNHLVYTKGYGLTKADSTQLVSPNTIFEAASLSKPVFAYVVLQLVEEGLLDLDKPLYEYLPYPDAADDDRYKKITTRLVLSHRTGFPNWRQPRPSPHINMLFVPGEKFGYSGEGYVYLQKVIEKITGQPIQDVMKARVFNPLAMRNSSYVWQPSLAAQVAFPHNAAEKPTLKDHPQQANMAYSLHTTAEDYARFIQAILTHRGVNESTIDKMLQPASPVPARMTSDTLSLTLSWGLGFALERAGDSIYFWHWGDNGNFKCFMVANRTEKAAVVYFTNSSNGLVIADQVIDQIMGKGILKAAFTLLTINSTDYFRKHPSRVK